MTAGLYLHIPFCRSKCRYCDFNSYENPEIGIDDYCGLLQREIETVSSHTPLNDIRTVYIGGGTPSLLSPRQVKRLLESVKASYQVSPDAEITMEVNPGTLSTGTLAGYRAAGVNRLSIGVQSMDDGELALLGRIHTSSDVQAAFLEARRAGFDNIGIDLIHSLPGQTLGRWQESLKRAIGLGPEHISAYGLSVEEETPFASMVASGELVPVDSDLSAEMFEVTVETLNSAAYEHYEISNFALPGRGSAHNRLYWRRCSYAGFGAGAHSFLKEPGFGIRWSNPASLGEYAASLKGGASARDEQPLTIEDAMAEFFFLGLRMLDGVDLAEFENEFVVSSGDVFPGVIKKYEAAGLLLLEGTTVRFSRKGVLLANLVLADFV